MSLMQDTNNYLRPPLTLHYLSPPSPSHAASGRPRSPKEASLWSASSASRGCVRTKWGGVIECYVFSSCSWCGRSRVWVILEASVHNILQVSRAPLLGVKGGGCYCDDSLSQVPLLPVITLEKRADCSAEAKLKLRNKYSICITWQQQQSSCSFSPPSPARSTLALDGCVSTFTPQLAVHHETEMAIGGSV